MSVLISGTFFQSIWNQNTGKERSYRNPMTVHERKLLGIINEPSFWPELVCIIAPDARVAVLDPRIDTDNGLDVHIT